MDSQYQKINSFMANEPDPNKKKSNADEVVNQEEENIVNTGEQDQVLNESDGGATPNQQSEEKRKGYEEGNRNDSLTEPELRDSDDQLAFPDEEGK